MGGPGEFDPGPVRADLLSQDVTLEENGGGATNTPPAIPYTVYAPLAGIGMTVFFRIHASSSGPSNLTRRPSFI